jgi:hypothetical protein
MLLQRIDKSATSMREGWRRRLMEYGVGGILASIKAAEIEPPYRMEGALGLSPPAGCCAAEKA